MSEFHSNITFGKSKAQIEIDMLESIWSLDDTDHCCFCDPQSCNPSIPSGDCGCMDDWS